MLHKLNILTTQFCIFSQYYQYLQTWHDQLLPHTSQFIIHHHINTLWNIKYLVKNPKNQQVMAYTYSHRVSRMSLHHYIVNHMQLYVHTVCLWYTVKLETGASQPSIHHEMVGCRSRELNIWIWSCITWHSNMNCPTWINTVIHATHCSTPSQTPHFT